MAKTKQTDKYDRFMDYLDANIFSHQQCMLEDKQYIDLYREIKKLLEKKSRGGRIVSSDYKLLASISCPNENITSLFIELTGNTATNMYSPSDNCYSNECSECWKKYIDFLTESINNSDALTKRFVPDIIHKRFNELEALYLDSEDKKGGRD